MNHAMDVKIYYEDTDCGGVVYYANYLRYMERARTEYLASRGYSVKTLMDQGTIFMVFRVEIDYKAPARYGDTIEIETWVTDVTRATMQGKGRCCRCKRKAQTPARRVCGKNKVMLSFTKEKMHHRYSTTASCFLCGFNGTCDKRCYP
jgi:tol-pal system-associated acyl-CoA thioesterase